MKTKLLLPSDYVTTAVCLSVCLSIYYNPGVSQSVSGNELLGGGLHSLCAFLVNDVIGGNQEEPEEKAIFGEGKWRISKL